MKGIEEVTVQRAAGQGMVIFVGTLFVNQKKETGKNVKKKQPNF